MARRRPYAHGFTLLEVLIVIVLIGLVMAVTVARIGDRRSSAVVATEAQRLAALIELARERAEVSAEEWGVDFEPTGYTFVVFDARTRRWLESPDARFRARTLPDVMALGVEVDARNALTQSRDRRARPRDDEHLPEVLMLSSGELSQFVLRIALASDPAATWEVRTDGIGPVRALALGERS